MPPLQARKESVLPTLWSTERRCLRDHAKAEAYRIKIEKIIQAGVIQEVTQETSRNREVWYIPHHLVSHNRKKSSCL